MAGDPYSAYGGSVTETQPPATNAQPSAPTPDPYAAYGGQSSQPNADPYASYGGSVGAPQQTPAAQQPPKPSVWQKIRDVWDTATSVPTPVLVARLFGPKAAAAADVVATGILPGAPLQNIFSHMAESQNPVAHDVGAVYSKAGDVETGLVKSGESPVGILTGLTGAEPIAGALPKTARALATAEDIGFAGEGISSAATPKQKNETDWQYAQRLGAAGAQVLLPMVGIAARFTESNAAAEALRAKIGSPTSDQIDAGVKTGKAVIVGTQASTVPVVSKEDVLNSAITKTLQVESALKNAGIDPSTIRTANDVSKMLDDARSLVASQLDPRVTATIGFSAQKQLAESLDMSTDELLQRQSGTAFNAEQAIASRAILQSSQQNLLDAAKAAANGGKPEMDTAMRALAQHVLIRDQVSGVASEAGRALGSFRNDQLPDSRATIALTKAFNTMNPAAKQKAIQMLAKLDTSDERAVNRFVAEISPSTPADKIYELYVNSLLSSPHVVLVKATSEAMTMALETMRQGVAGAMSHFGDIIRQRDPSRFASESFWFARGAWESLADAPKILSGKLDVADSPEFESAGKRAIKGSLGAVVRIPGTILNRQTNLVYWMNRQGMLNALAARRAYSEGLSGDDLNARIAYLSKNPTSQMSQVAHDFALRGTFQQELGRFGKSIQNVTNNANVGVGNYKIPLGRLLVPFMRTPINIVKTGLAYSPLGLAKSAFTGDVDAAARGLIGSSIAGAIAYGTLTGHITGGGPLNYQKREAQEDTGWQPYSLHIGDTYISLHKAEPIGLVLGLTADATTALANQGVTPSNQSAAHEAVKYIARNIDDLPFLETISNLSESLDSTDPLSSAQRFLRFEAGSAVPSVIRNAALIADPTYRRAQSIPQGIEANTPGLTENVPAVTGTDAQPVTRPESGLGGINPFPVTTAKGDAATDEIARLGEASIQPVKTITIDGQRVQLTPDESQALQLQDEKQFYDWMAAVVREPEYQELTDAAKVKMTDAVRREVAKTRAARLAAMRNQQ